MKKYKERGTQLIEAQQFDICDDRNWPPGVERVYLDGEPTKMHGSRVVFFIDCMYNPNQKVNNGNWIVYISGTPYYVMEDWLFHEHYEEIP
jgi:hypothetical protein